MNNNRFVILLFFIFFIVLSACGTEQELNNANEPNDNDNNAVQKEQDHDNNDEREEEESEQLTMSSMELTPFEEVEGKTTVRFETNDWNDPNDEQEDLRADLFYGDQEVLVAAVGKGIFRYDLETHETLWNVNIFSENEVIVDNLLYATGLNSNQGVINVISLTDEEIIHSFVYEEYEFLSGLNIYEDTLNFVGRYDQGDDFGRDLVHADLKTGEILWKVPIYALDTYSIGNEDDSIIIRNLPENNEGQLLEDEEYYGYDKETGENIFKIKRDTLQFTPVANEYGVYFLDHVNNLIQLYSFDGELIME